MKLRLVPPLGKPIDIDKDSVLIGRELTCDIVLNDGSVSRRHAKIERIEGTWKITDQGSANGTFLDSQRITGSFLKGGQELRLGGMVFRVEIEEPSSPDLTATVAATPPPDRVAAPPPPPIPAPAPRPVPPPAPPAVPTAAPPLPPRHDAAAPPPPPPPRPAAPIPRIPPPPPRPAPPPAEMAPVPKKGRGAGTWIAGGCCGCLVILLLLGALLWSFMPRIRQMIEQRVTQQSSGAVEAVEAQLAALRGGDVAQAYTSLGSAMQAEMALQDFHSLVSSHPGLAENEEALFTNRTIVGDTARLAGVLVSRSGAREAVTYDLVREAGAWKVSGIVFSDAPSS